MFGFLERLNRGLSLDDIEKFIIGRDRSETFESRVRALKKNR